MKPELPALSLRGALAAMALLLLLSLVSVMNGEARAQEGVDETKVEIDMSRARELLQKQRDGVALTPEEAAYLEKAREARRTQIGARRPGEVSPAPAGGEGKTSVGFVPLPDLEEGDTYQGQSGGLYGDGKNQPPAILMEAAEKAAARIQPLDGEGNPAAGGKIVLLSNGMSNTTQEFGQFVRLANADAAKNPHVIVVDGAIGGQEASDWTSPDNRLRKKEKANPWEALDRRLEKAGVTHQQVQVLWVKQARRQPSALGEFPEHAEVLRDNLAELMRMMKSRFPNLQIAYLSSRTYAGYAVGTLNPEPYAYESAFSVRWLIEDQAKGEPALNHDPEKGEVKAPVLLWGPYLWAEGEKGRKQDDLVWKREDFGTDGTHPSDSGREKVARLLLEFFKADETARPWFRAQ